MDKLKRLLALPVLYHVAIFVAMVCFSLTKDADLNMVVALMLDFAGVLIGAMFLAVISIIHAILHDGKVYDYLYYCLAIVFIVGIMRVVVYKLAIGTSACLIGAGAGVATLGIFVIWDCLFAFTDHMMKKRTGRKNKH